jgi:hypothetical protein
LVPGLGLQDIPQGLLSTVKRVTIVVVQPIVFERALDFKQLGSDHNSAIPSKSSGRPNS